MSIYSTKEISPVLIEEIIEALQNVRWGSVEIFVQDSQVVQITERNIRKTRPTTIKGQKNGSKTITAKLVIDK